jgi:hypothetical protein
MRSMAMRVLLHNLDMRVGADAFDQCLLHCSAGGIGSAWIMRRRHDLLAGEVKLAGMIFITGERYTCLNEHSDRRFAVRDDEIRRVTAAQPCSCDSRYPVHDRQSNHHPPELQQFLLAPNRSRHPAVRVW